MGRGLDWPPTASSFFAIYPHNPTFAAAFSVNSEPSRMYVRRTGSDLCPLCLAITRSLTLAIAAAVISPAPLCQDQVRHQGQQLLVELERYACGRAPSSIIGAARTFALALSMTISAASTVVACTFLGHWRGPVPGVFLGRQDGGSGGNLEPGRVLWGRGVPGCPPVLLTFAFPSCLFTHVVEL
jgi:hypothetical protein